MRDPLADRAAVTPEATALIDADRDERWSVADLDSAVERTAGRLATLGVRPGDRLGTLLPTRPAAVRVIYAAVRLGATLVPLGARLTPDELAVRIERADVTTLVCDATTEADAVAATAAAGDVPVPVVSVDDADAERVTALDTHPPEAVVPQDWALDSTLLIPFTSGTTGAPKGVRLTLRNVLASAVASVFRLGLRRDETWHVALPLHHVGGLTPVLRMPLYGMTVVLRDSFDAAAVAADFERYDVTATSLVPTTLSRLLDATEGDICPTLRTVLLGGAPATGTLLDRCVERSVPVFPTYGMTETASQIATATPAEAASHPGTVGRPLFWTDLSVRDDEGNARPPGETGELVVSGPTVSPGYLDAEATAAAFGDGGLRTGDVGYREDGLFWVVGRTDDLIVTGGENVAPAEVVDALRDHPDVADAAVVGVPDAEWGERVAALVVPREGADPAASALDEHCRARLAGYKVPRTIRFVDAIPRTASGTVDRAAVRDRLP
ncbi:o-succinylbenzoate--CoA ligase [Haloplanus rubicundus]|uniref:O-succinylbenzoate--CoA ligase n=1 Tax=Haloplanus rubicundus TaxID=1547898 RepID=A0A345E5C7_9EURY|nr:o-succinylbenzoate--CoA ligase [Haloplanus rubicundus]AXG07399.1 o-succinylbenzoate--CoA ligase [Haloplanus rubicundus]